MDYNICTTLVWDADSGGSSSCGKAENLQELCVLSAQCCCDPTTALKNDYLTLGRQRQEPLPSITTVPIITEGWWGLTQCFTICGALESPYSSCMPRTFEPSR